MAKFTKPPTQTFEAEAAESGARTGTTTFEPPQEEESMLDGLASFVENDAIFVVLIAVIVIFLAFQLGRWALNRESGAFEDDGEHDQRQHR